GLLGGLLGPLLGGGGGGGGGLL
uniref:Leptoglycin n=1 Tax=Leptodactylus pentadactylus TaxID=47564 RepID=LEPT_LEPPE|nr:RecName: Full=Leptoglycin [Leptodactylus pentadactylus]